MANIQEVADLAGVSKGTVSRYLNGIKIRDKNAAAIARAIQDLDYRPSPLGRALTTKRSYSIGILVAHAGNVFVSSSIGELESEFEQRGYTSLFIDFRGSVQLLRQKVAFLRERLVDGLIVFLSETDTDHLGFLFDLDIPVIVVDNPVDDVRADSIVVDNADSVERVIGAMIGAGHSRIGIITSSQDTYVGATRLAGWRRALGDAGLAAREDDIARCQPTKQGGYEGARALLDKGNISALFACNYYTALGAMKALNERGLKPGVDIGFASFDDYDYSNVVQPPLTVIRQPMGDIVDAIVHMMCGRIDGTREAEGLHVMPSTVVLTDSIKGGL